MQKPFILLLILLAFIFSGCYKVNKDIVKKPVNLIPKDKMAGILTDMELIEGAVVYNRTHYPEYTDIEKSYYEVLFDHYHVTKSQIKASLNYYNSQGDEVAKIYDKVLSKLSEEQGILNEEIRKKENKKFRDENNYEDNPFLYRENNFGNLCINPFI
ncbi:MAG TPA: DUF4296 domain-containing protein [Bacteroidetes bacterium]|nr:DUF4296 domain-containing protein [Bacteroidota bacterium]